MLTRLQVLVLSDYVTSQGISVVHSADVVAYTLRGYLSIVARVVDSRDFHHHEVMYILDHYQWLFVVARY